MTIINSLFQPIPARFRTLAKRLSYFSFGSILTVFYAQLGHAQSTGSQPITQNPYSFETIVAAAIGAVITIFFLKGMYLVLTYASETYGLEDDDSDFDEEKENNALLWGAIAWVVGSAAVIASYGLGWGFLYIGPILCLLGPVVPIFAMNGDLKKYRKVLAARTAQDAVQSKRTAYSETDW